MFERCLYFNVNALARAVNRIWDEAFAEFNLSPSHAYLLRLVLAEPGLTAREISQELKLDKSTITRFLNALQDKGLVKRRAGLNEDAREQAIFPTASATKMASSLEHKGDELYKEMLRVLGRNKMQALVRDIRDSEAGLR